MARVFSAVDVSGSELKDELERIRNRLDLGFRPVSKHRMHVTFQFFRDIEEEDIERLKEAAKKIDIEQEMVEVKGVGTFPSDDHIRVAWAGFQEETALREIHRQVSSHAVPDDNDHAFKPHITLLRVKNANREQERKLLRTKRDFEDHRFGSMSLNSIKIYRSELSEGGSRYSEIYSRDL